MIDYEILRMLWWLLLGVLIIGFAIMDGFDLGVGILLPYVGRSDLERRTVINTVGPVWEGNQVWIILGAGAIFAAWPTIYAVTFSSFYFAMFLALLGFILRPVGFKYRSKIANPTWRSAWDVALFLGGLIPTFVFGVAVGNVLQGIPFYFDDSLRSFYLGTFWGLLNPFGLFCGILSIAMFCMHAGNYLAIKTADVIQKRAVYATQIASLLVVLLFILGGFWVAYWMEGYVVSSAISVDGPSNPLYKTVVQQIGAWVGNYKIHPWMVIAPFLGIAGALLAMLFATRLFSKWAFLFSSISLLGIISTVGLSMFPFILPSTVNPGMGMLLWDSSSSQMTLFIMLIATLFFMPIILLYTAWVYYVLRGKVTAEYVEKHSDHLY